MLIFEWSKEKNKVNINKHNLSFDEAKEAFYDEYSLELFDEEHSDTEDRFFLMGMVKTLKIVCVAYCVRENDIIRLISARYATKKEISEYEKRRDQ